MNVHVIFSLGGGAGRSLSAALTALELRAEGKNVRLVQLGHEAYPDAFEPGERFPVPRIRWRLRPAKQARRSEHPAFDLTLRALAPFERDGGYDPDASLCPLVERWRRAIAVWGSGADDIAVDMPALSVWEVWPLLHFATTVTIPVRSSPIEIETAVRSFTGLVGATDLIGSPLRPRFAQLVPLEQLGAHADRILALMAAYDPAAELVNEDRPLHYKTLSFLDDRVLQHIVDEEPWWDEI